MEQFPKFIAAAVQASPVFLNREATIEKACKLIREAANNGAKLVAFPEAYVPGFPYWNWIMNPFEGSKWYRELYKCSIEVPSKEVDSLCQVAAETGTYVVIGVNERNPISLGIIYNTNLIIGPEGKVLGRHRKLVPTWAEKLTWTGGDGASLKVYDTEVGRLGTLMCGENTNTLSRFTLLAQGELVHVANYPAFPFTDQYDMPSAIQIRAGAHAFEGKIYVIVPCSALSDEIIDMVCQTEEQRKMMSNSSNAFSGIYGPDGQLISEPLIDEEGIVYGEIDLERCIEPKQYHDIIGHYNRFDIFNLQVNRKSHKPISFDDGSTNLSLEKIEEYTHESEKDSDPE